MKINISKEHVEGLMDNIINLHDSIIDATGGEKGIRDEGGLYNSCYKILSFWKKKNEPFLDAAFIYLELAKRHHFVDGNKRTSHVIAKASLISDGFHFKAPYKSSENFIISIAKEDKNINEIRIWLKENSTEIEEKDIETYLKDLFKELVRDTNDTRK